MSWTLIKLECAVTSAVLIHCKLEVSPWPGHTAGGGTLGPQLYKQIETAAFSEPGPG